MKIRIVVDLKSYLILDYMHTNYIGSGVKTMYSDDMEIYVTMYRANNHS